MRRMLFRIVILLSLLAAPPGSTALAQGAEPAAPTGTVTLWYGFGVGSTEETALNQVIAATESANPGLNIVQQHHDDPWADYETAFQAGGGPDLLLASNDPISNQALSGRLLNLDTYLTGRLGNVKQFAVSGMTVAGHIYGVPESAATLVLFYNKSLVPAPPTTTTQLLSMLQGGKTLAASYGPFFLYGFFGAFGGQLLDASGRCIADKGGFAPAMQYMLNLQAAGAQLHVDYALAENQFLAGSLGMLINGPWALQSYEGSAIGSDLGIAVLPAGPSGPARPFTAFNAFFVNPHTSAPANTVETALYMTNQASSQVFTNVGAHVPVRSDVTPSDPLISVFASASEQGQFSARKPQMDWYWEPFNTMFTDVLSHAISPAAGVSRACKTMNYKNGFSVADTVSSTAVQDGWVLEGSELSGKGLTYNSTATVFNVGDSALDQQYRGILSFNTAGLPDDAVITKVTLKVKRQGAAGTNPFATLGNILIDVRKGAFSTSVALQPADFQATPSKAGAGTIKNLPLAGAWYQSVLSGTAFPYINRTGFTQFRLRFAKDDDDDRLADYLKFYSGNISTSSYRPVLIVTYHSP